MSLVSKVEIRKSLIEGAGWGAFITEDVMKGALIEECVVFPNTRVKHMGPIKRMIITPEYELGF